jgi:ATPase subunit of ABC transporter with duplicated ATPase domains
MSRALDVRTDHFTLVEFEPARHGTRRGSSTGFSISYGPNAVYIDSQCSDRPATAPLLFPVGAAVSSSLVARDITKSFGPRVVLERVSFTIGPEHRVGIVAPNGTGKSTLLKILAGLDRPDAGSVVRSPRTATVGYLPQEPERRPGETVLAYLARRTGVADAELELDAASQQLAAPQPGADEAYADALDRYLALGAADFEARVGAVCDDIGLPARVLDLDMPSLSGGQAARAGLAAILLARFDVFLLDEPTNDLDFAGLARLERFLADELTGGAAIVSHDRAFLDRTITSVLELDDHDHTATEYAGGWQSYLDERATARRHAEEDYSTYQSQRRELTDRAQTQRQWSVQGAAKVKKSGETDKHIRQFKRNSSEHVAAKAKITDKALERLERNAIDKPWEGWDLRMEIASAPRSGAVVARLNGAVVRRGDFVLGPVDLQINYGERVAILGANGSGKTTLLDALLGRRELSEGSGGLGNSVIVGELDQARADFAGDEPLLARFEALSGLLAQVARSLLAKFGLSAEHIARPSRSLSPGERTRASLALLSARGVNCLVLDEPTNHLDLPAIEQLESALANYEGTLLLVTHDRALLAEVTLTRRIELDAGRVTNDEPVG